MNLKDTIRIIPDFPQPGVRFKDITTLLQNPQANHELIDRMVQSLEGRAIDIVVGPEARGFVVGAPLAYALHAGFVPARRPGKLPYETFRYAYNLEYGQDELEIHRDAIVAGQKVVVVDDLLATGGTALATTRMIEKMGGVIIAIRFAIELTDLNGREILAGYDVDAVIKY